MSEDSPLPSPSKVAAAAAAASAVEADLNIVVPSLGPDATLEERQLAEFNNWLKRYNNYQHQMEAYWRGRLKIEASARGDGNAVTQGKEESFVTSYSKKGSINKNKWLSRYEELIQFKEEHGHTNVPSHFIYKLENPALGDWVKRLRSIHRGGKLSEDRQKLLLDIGFEFDNPKKAADGVQKVVFSGVWNKAYMELSDYRDQHGDIEVPDNYKHTPESSCFLDNWIKRQRSAFKAGKLDNDLIQKLEEVGVDLSGRARPFGCEIDANWVSKYKELKAYTDENGDCNAPEDDTDLGDWVKEQREAYGEGKLNEHKTGMLENIGFYFYSSERKGNEDPWDIKFQELRAYAEIHGDANVPKYFPLNMALGDFVNDLRVDYQHGKLTEARKKKLQALGFTFVPNKGRKGTKKWDTFFDELKFYKAKHGTIDIPKGDKQNEELAGWIVRQRRYQRDGTLKKDRFKRLKKFGFDFDKPATPRVSWESQYQAVVDFKEENGHIKIPTNYEQNPSLYFWIGTQRQSYKLGKLSEERIAKLIELGVDLESQTRERKAGKAGPAFLNSNEFDRCLAALIKYKEEHGDCNVPQREEKDRLGSFVHYMRYYHRQGRLSEERVKKLEDIGFLFNVVDNRWSEKYEELAAFFNENGNCDLPINHKLYAWAAYQRQAYKNGKLAEDRFELLRKIDFKLEVKAGRKLAADSASPHVVEKAREDYLSELWEKSYNELVAYKEKYGNCKIPVNYTANTSLGAWAFAQRMAHKKNKLSEERAQKLTEIGLLEPGNTYKI